MKINVVCLVLYALRQHLTKFDFKFSSFAVKHDSMLKNMLSLSLFVGLKFSPNYIRNGIFYFFQLSNEIWASDENCFTHLTPFLRSTFSSLSFHFQILLFAIRRCWILLSFWSLALIRFEYLFNMHDFPWNHLHNSSLGREEKNENLLSLCFG